MRSALAGCFLLFGFWAMGQKVLGPYTYSNNFESHRLGAWASYPLWQDNAYDENFRVRPLIAGDSNFSLVEKVTPYSAVDNYAGAQKLLNIYLVPGSAITLRYYLKSAIAVASFTIRLAAGAYGALNVTLDHPAINRWVWVTVGFNDFLRDNPRIAAAHDSSIRIYALAFLARIPRADPDMPIYLGLDDISFTGARPVDFRFDLPVMDRLPEFAEYIPQRVWHSGDTLGLRGQWPVGADEVSLRIVSFTDREKSLFRGGLDRRADEWAARGVKLSFPPGLYLGRLVAYKNKSVIGETTFTLHIASDLVAGGHPRLLFDKTGEEKLKAKLSQPRFREVYASLLREAKTQRDKVPVAGLVYDLNQFPDENWLPSWGAFGEQIYSTGPALKANALAYAVSGDTAAGEYVRNTLVTIAGWPDWVSPWMKKRGRYADHRMGTWAHQVALAYDLVYGLMTPQQSALIRAAIMKNIVEGAHYTYVYDNEVTSNTSNWIAHIMGGSLMCMAAIDGDGVGTGGREADGRGAEADSPDRGGIGRGGLEPYFTGALLKFYAMLTHVTDTIDGFWGEGWGYNNYTFSNLAYSLPALKQVYGIDLSGPLHNSYNEFIWGGLIKARKWFGFGDSGDSLLSADNWAFLLSMDKEPRLNWYYHYLKTGLTFNDVLFDTDSIPAESPFREDPVKVFRKVGTTVFKGGWEKNDFAFVMRTGPFFNHQHLDQGSFWLADHGITFIGDQPIHHSDYYSDPLYQSTFIQPIAHSTILINGNAQSQRVGDPLDFAPGFDDHAFIDQFMEGEDAAFSSGDIGRLYWGAVDTLVRDVLFIKPRTVLMLDVVAPPGGGRADAGNRSDVDVSLLYHAPALKDIVAGRQISRISKDGYDLNIVHLAPDSVQARAVETPHYLNTLLKERPLVPEGMLTVTARTNGGPLVMANLLTTTAAGVKPVVTSRKGDGFVWGEVSGRQFAFSVRPGKMYRVEAGETDALTLTWSDSSVFVAMATVFRNKRVDIESDGPMTFQLKGHELKYCRSSAGMVRIRMGGSGRWKSVKVTQGEGRIKI